MLHCIRNFVACWQSVCRGLSTGYQGRNISVQSVCSPEQCTYFLHVEFGIVMLWSEVVSLKTAAEEIFRSCTPVKVVIPLKLLVQYSNTWVQVKIFCYCSTRHKIWSCTTKMSSWASWFTCVKRSVSCNAWHWTYILLFHMPFLHIFAILRHILLIYYCYCYCCCLDEWQSQQRLLLLEKLYRIDFSHMIELMLKVVEVKLLCFCVAYFNLTHQHTSRKNSKSVLFL